MIAKSKLVKCVALYLSANMLFQVFFPPVALALTSGPTAPEYSSFEPVDVTDMVNLSTGDFSYVMPLIEVPGPEGGYPLALSYHAGIKPDQEASWVGLGWTLNPGAISRMVNVFPDDAYASVNSVQDIGAGGQTEMFSVGIGYGAVSFGLVFANDTYKGFGVGASLGVGVPVLSGSNGALGAGVGISSGPYGGTYASLGVSAGTPGNGIKASMSAGATYDFQNKTVSSYMGVGIGYSEGSSSVSLVGASIASNDMKMTSSLAGITLSSVNEFQNNLTIESSSFAVPIPIWTTGIILTLGYSRTRYYLNQSDFTYAYGSLYPDHTPDLTTQYEKTAFDCYPLVDPGSGVTADPNVTMGGSLPAYDNYTVMAQGVGGGITPSIYSFGSLYRRNTYDEDGDPVLEFDKVSSDYNYSGKTQFRFLNDFSNGFIRTTNFADYNSDPFTDWISQNSNTMVGEFKESLTGTASNISPYYDVTANKLAGSKNIEWFTNEEINNGTAKLKGFMDFYSSNNQRNTNFVVDGVSRDVRDQIGGFMITNESGVTYHYALPVYNYENNSKSENTAFKSSRETYERQPYAYTWLLTGITGPDFVDRESNGVINYSDDGVDTNDDWGYWVKFDYGRWTQKHIWRNPPAGTHKDIDSDVDFYSAGVKELYYLDAVQTRSHTALFIKDIRKDGKGCMSFSGGFGVSGYDISAASMRLDKILLFTNNELARGINELSNIFTYNSLRSLNSHLQHTAPPSDYVLHSAHNVLDVYDVSSLNGNLADYAEREIVFDHSYDLCRNTPNSLDIDYSNFSYNTTPGGKLTLNSIAFHGKGGETILPPITFEYAYNPSYEDRKDIWGMYHSFLYSFGSDLRKMSRYPTAASAANTDAWSLTAINTSLGSTINIEYESDSYSTSIYTDQRNFSVRSMKPVSGIADQIDVELYENETANNINSLSIGKTIKLFALLRQPPGEATCGPDIHTWHHVSDVNAVIISHPNNYKIRIQSPSIYNELVKTYPLTYYFPNCIPKTYTTAELIGGNILAAHAGETLGGGLRVKQIKLITDEREFITEYTYTNGTTSYEPTNYNVNILSTVGNYSIGATPGDTEEKETENINIYKDNLFPTFATISALQSVIPGPGVMYGEVTVTDKVKDKITNQAISVPGKSVYEFTTMDAALERRTASPGYTVADGTVNRYANVVTLKNYISRIGNLKSVSSYDAANNLVSKIENTYLHEEAGTAYETELTQRFNNQGRLDEMYYEARKHFDLVKKLMITKVEHHPSVPVSKKHHDYRTGIVTETRTLAYDYLSGEPTVIMSHDGMNNYFMAVTRPAYKEYTAMGAKGVGIGNKNMLSQVAASYLYKVDPNIAAPLTEADYDKVGLLSASAQTWSNAIPEWYKGTSYTGNAWRKHETYTWLDDNTSDLVEDGTTGLSGFAPFDFSNLTANSASWNKTSEVQAVGVYSNVLQASDINNNTTVSLYDPEQRHVIASASFANLDEVAAAGAEFMEGNTLPEGNTGRGNGIVSNAFAHTGMFSLKADAGEKAFTFNLNPDPAKKYFASVWIYMPGEAQDNNDLDNVTLTAKRGASVIATANRKRGNSAQNWHLVELVIDPAGYTGAIEISCNNASAERSVYFDDFRVHPLESGIMTYVYDRQTTLLTHILDNDNLYTRYKYNTAGNVTEVYREIFYPVEKLVTRQHKNHGLFGGSRTGKINNGGTFPAAIIDSNTQTE